MLNKENPIPKFRSKRSLVSMQCPFFYPQKTLSLKKLDLLFTPLKAAVQDTQTGSIPCKTTSVFSLLVSYTDPLILISLSYPPWRNGSVCRFECLSVYPNVEPSALFWLYRDVFLFLFFCGVISIANSRGKFVLLESNSSIPYLRLSLMYIVYGRRIHWKKGILFGFFGVSVGNFVFVWGITDL